MTTTRTTAGGTELRVFGPPRVDEFVRALDLDPEVLARLAHPSGRGRLAPPAAAPATDTDGVVIEIAEAARRRARLSA